jgi:toxin-antitoxin system PIN domain toxin
VTAVSLLDANVLIALAWPAHSAHSRVRRWFENHGQNGWATCPFTQCAFVRIVSNPAFSPHALSVAEAMRLLRLNVQHPAHRFWPDDIPFNEAVQSFEDRLVGHQQVTDAYLLGLAVHKKGKLATLDKSFATLLRQHGPARASLELLA